MKNRLLDEATTIAFEQRDINSLQSIQMAATKANKREIIEKVESLISQLNTRK